MAIQLAWSIVQPGLWMARGGWDHKRKAVRQYRAERVKDEAGPGYLWLVSVRIGLWHPWSEIDWAPKLAEAQRRADGHESKELQPA